MTSKLHNKNKDELVRWLKLDLDLTYVEERAIRRLPLSLLDKINKRTSRSYKV